MSAKNGGAKPTATAAGQGTLVQNLLAQIDVLKHTVAELTGVPKQLNGNLTANANANANANDNGNGDGDGNGNAKVSAGSTSESLLQKQTALLDSLPSHLRPKQTRLPYHLPWLCEYARRVKDDVRPFGLSPTRDRKSKANAAADADANANGDADANANGDANAIADADAHADQDEMTATENDGNANDIAGGGGGGGSPESKPRRARGEHHAVVSQWSEMFEKALRQHLSEDRFDTINLQMYVFVLHCFLHSFCHSMFSPSVR